MLKFTAIFFARVFGLLRQTSRAKRHVMHLLCISDHRRASIQAPAVANDQVCEHRILVDRVRLQKLFDVLDYSMGPCE